MRENNSQKCISPSHKKIMKFTEICKSTHFSGHSPNSKLTQSLNLIKLQMRWKDYIFYYAEYEFSECNGPD